jgi:hypothetical protein
MRFVVHLKGNGILKMGKTEISQGTEKGLGFVERLDIESGYGI